MRHFEDFEIEHLINSTGSLWLRWRCKLHLRNCEICQKRFKKLLEDKNFEQHLRTAIFQLKEVQDDEENNFPHGK